MTFVMPHTNTSAPVRVRLSDFNTMPTHDGAAVHLVVHINGTAVGTVEDHGTGGGAWFYQVSPEGRKAFDALRDQARGHDGKPFPDEEALCNRLADEAEIAHLVRRANKKRGKFAVLITDSDNEFGVTYFTHAPWAGTYPQPRQLRRLQLPAGTVRASVWHGAGGWVTFFPAND